MFDGETFDREAICNLIDDLERKSIRSVNGLIKLDNGRYEEVLYNESVYTKETMAIGSGIRWRYKISFGDRSLEGFSLTLRVARLNLLKILKSKLERNGN